MGSVLRWWLSRWGTAAIRIHVGTGQAASGGLGLVLLG